MNSALIVVDVQNDFCIGGSLEVKNADEIFPVINQLNEEFKDKFPVRILTQDWHPEEHISFIGNKLESKLVNPSEITLKWKGAFPIHCVQNTFGAEIHKGLKIHSDFLYVKKGYDPLEEAFSGFFNPELDKILKERGVKKVLVVGLAYDFCVAHTAYDAAKLGYKTFVLKEACRQISDETAKEAEDNFSYLGIEIIKFGDVEKFFE